MKRFFTSLLLSVLFFGASYAQSSITGKLVDAETNETLIGASVYLEGTDHGTVSDLDGTFLLENVEAGTYNVIISYTGFSEQRMEITLKSGPEVGAEQALDLGTMKMTNDAVGLTEVNVIASVAVDRKTPVAVTTIKGAEVAALVGNQEYPEILKKTPSVYVTKSGGGFGDARINVRGFDQRNVAVMINGIPVNDMENGWVYWSNWAGLSDITSNLQIQRGLGASKLAVPSVGGSINIITNAAEMTKGGTVRVGMGNDGYQKYGLSYNTGLSESGWALSAQATHTQGNGYVNGTKFSAYSYFLSVSKTFSEKSTLSFTVLGAPQWHHQRLIGRFDKLTVGNFLEKDTDVDGASNVDDVDKFGRRFNHLYGQLDGKEFSWRRNFYHKPKAFLNHYLTINEKISLKTSAYYSQGRGGGTGLRGRINGNDTDNFYKGRIFDSFAGLGLGVADANGQVRWDDIIAYNQGRDVAGFGDADAEPGTTTSSGDGMVRRASMNSHNWMGVLSTLTAELNSNWTFTTGIDLRYYKGIHYRRLENLLGNDSYLSRSDDNNPNNVITETSPANFGNFSDNSYKNGNNVLAYHNDGIVNWAGLFAQMEYSNDKINAFLSLNGSNQGFKRIDYFNYLESDPARETDFANFIGGNIKTGININVSDASNFYVNAGYISTQPIFRNVYIKNKNILNEKAKNQSVVAFEAGYGFRAGNFRTKINAYFTQWGNRQLITSNRNSNGEEIQYVFDNITQVHSGLEMELNWQPTRAFGLTGMLSLGNWNYKDNFNADGYNLDTDQPDGDLTIFADKLKVGDAAQTTFNLGAKWEIVDGLKFYADYYLAANLYAQFDVNDRAFQKEGVEVIKLPTYSLVDAGLSYNFKLGGQDLTFRLNVNNLLDTWYIAELDTNKPELMDNRGFVGFGRTWNFGIKYKF